MTLSPRFQSVLLATGLVVALFGTAQAQANSAADPLNAKPASSSSYEDEDADDPEKSDFESYDDEKADDEKSSDLKGYDEKKDGKGSIDSDGPPGYEDSTDDDGDTDEKKSDLKSYDKEKKVNDKDFSDSSSGDNKSLK